ncbi:hypothetical protein Taro_027820 [Colocasia esculenta]|uniref:Uncharacterized protein n=1 Tax=Colocasia esculenta TaxID=4460 RepID=A0A843VFK9_COLES|nr:hypothetical protein [Colocasia esculenta]
MDALQGKGFARFVGEGLWSVGARRRRVANLREGPLWLSLLFEGKDLLVSWEKACGALELEGGGLLAYEKGPCG